MRRLSGICAGNIARRSFFNERIFRERGAGSALDNAKTALLQYNIMIDRGIVPDVLTYTSLIDTMAKAKLEWQAYKLFSSMIDRGIEPVPETLVALRNATRPSRKKLIDDISDRIENMAQSSPQMLVKDVEDIIKEGEASEQMKIDGFFKSESLPLDSAHVNESEVDPLLENSILSDDEPPQVGTVGIEHPVHSWNVFSKASDDKASSPVAKGDEVQELHSKLSTLHNEELQIFLAIHKLLRNGSHEELVSRILLNIPASVITSMLHRRHKYFRAVEGVTKVLLDNAKALAEDDARGVTTGNGPAEVSDELEPHKDAVDAHFQSGEYLYTPWGAIRKPVKAISSNDKPIVTKEMPLDAWEEVILRVTSGDIDQLPEHLLRQYTAHYSLSWDRSHPESLSKAVEWHVKNVLPSLLSEKRQAPPTLQAKLRREEVDGSLATLENYEALRIIAKRTKNLQVTDGVDEINTSVRRAAMRENVSAEKNAQEARKRENIRAAEDLKQRATQYSPSDDRLNYGQVLQEKHRELMARSSRVMLGPDVPYIGKPPAKTSSGDELPSVSKLTVSRKDVQQKEILQRLKGENSELPPWELSSASQPFNVDSGRFGDPTVGRYMELNDGKIQLMPQHESLSLHHASAALIPEQDREAVLRHKVHLRETRRKEQEEVTSKERMHTFQRFKKLVSTSQGREMSKKANLQGLEPIQERRPMRFTLRAGRDKKTIDSKRFERFTRPQ